MAEASVIIPARNAGRTLGACLAALANQCVPGPTIDLLVVDDRSTDDTRSIAARAGVRVVQGAGRGPAAARNLGARHARHAVLIFLDADTVPRPGWLAEMLAPLADGSVVAVKGRYYTRQRGLVPRFAQLEFEDKYARLERATRIDFVDSGTAAYRRDAFMAAGGFDEDFPAQSAEDVELAFRLSAAGARFVFNPRAGVWHAHAPTLASYLGKKARYGFFRVAVYERYPGKALGDSYTPPLMAAQIGLVGVSWLLALLCLGSPRRVAWLALGSVLGAFGMSTAPLIGRGLAHGPRLCASVPLLAYARAAAQGVGIALGLGRLLIGGRGLTRGTRAPIVGRDRHAPLRDLARRAELAPRVAVAGAWVGRGHSDAARLYAES